MSHEADTAVRTAITTVVGPHPFLAALRQDPECVDGARLDFDESYKPTHKAFRAMAEEQAFDLCEMAMATYVQARAAGKPLTMLPVSFIGRFQHPQLVRNTGRPAKTPQQLEGGRVGVRAYSQTTGVWVRSILRDQFGVDLSRVTWVVVEDSHVRGFHYPDNVVMADPGSDLHSLLEAGELDAVIGAYDAPYVGPLIDEPGASAEQWYASQGFVPVNHVLTVRQSLLEAEPALVRRLYRAFADAVAGRQRGSATSGDGWSWADAVDTLPTGYDRLQPVLERMAREVYAQGLIPEPLASDALISPAVRAWG